MKKPLLVCVMSLPLIAQGTWSDLSGTFLPDTESMRTDGNFGVHLLLTPDEKQFRQAWESTPETPVLNTTNAVRHGSSIAAILIFHGCSPNAVGVCDVNAEFFLEGPHGIKISLGGGPVWSVEALQEGRLQLGRTSMTVRFDANDPAGAYGMIANVNDKIAGRTLNLLARFNVTE